MNDHQKFMMENIEEYITNVMKLVMGQQAKNTEFEQLPYDLQNMILTHALKLQENSIRKNMSSTFSMKRFY